MRRDKHLAAMVLALLAIVALGAWLRLDGLAATGFRNCDEGYYFHPARVMMTAEQPVPILYYYHGTIVWVHLGCRLLGFTPAGALRWAALSGLAAIVLLCCSCRRLLPGKTALLAALALAFAYYPVYYSRINLSNIYGMLFTLLAMLPLADLAARLGRPAAPGRARAEIRRQALAAAAAGAVAGLAFHVRVESFLFLCGMAGALALAALIRPGGSARKALALRLALGVGIAVLAALAAYALFLLSYLPWIRPAQTVEWYLRNVPFMTGSANAWGPYLFEHLGRLTGVPFWALAAAGALSEMAGWRRLSLGRLWLLLCLLGALAGFILLGIPFPRGHLMLVVLMAIYWAIGVRALAARKPRWRGAVAVVLILLTFVGEFRLVRPLFARRARYDQAAQVMAAAPADAIHNGNWPILRSYLPGQKQFLLDELLPPGSDEAALRRLLLTGPERGFRYLVLDCFTNDDDRGRLLQRLALACPPVAILHNDFGDDYHNFMDARGRAPDHNLFSDKIILFDLAHLDHPLPEFPPYTTAADMGKRFLAGLSEKQQPQRGGIY